MAGLGQRWKSSLAFRRIVVVTAIVAAALAVYAGSLFPRAVALPTDEINTKSVAALGQQTLVIEDPSIAEGELLLSYEGSRNEVADLRADNATLDPGSQRLFFPKGVPPGPVKISYTTGDALQPAPGAPANADTCHTTIEIRRAPGSPPVDSFKLYQTDQTAGAQRFRQVVLDAGNATLSIDAHTDSPPQLSAAAVAATPGCQKVLTVADHSLQLPEHPVDMTVSSGPIYLHFYPSNPTLPIWTGPGDTFESVSLAAGTLHAKSIKVLPIQPVSSTPSSRPELAVQAHPAASLLSVSQLKLGSEMLRLQVGRDGETAFAQAAGVPIYNYNVTDMVQKLPIVKNNPVPSWGLGLLLITPLGAWIKKTCLPDSTEEKKP